MRDLDLTGARDGLDALLAPRSVAVVGASSDPRRIGGRPIDYYTRGGFSGALYPVNPARDEVQGRKAYPDIASIPDSLDFAVLAIAHDAIPAAIDECAKKGVKAIVVFSAGFAETGAAGRALQDDIVARAARAHIRLLGPNCLGLFNANAGHYPTFSSALQEALPRPGRVGLVTQSGAYGTHLLNMARDRRVDIGTWISTGNEADVTVAECLEHLVGRDDIDTIGCYMEAVNDGRRLFAALEAARRAGKVVAVMKAGTSAAGARAALSHTASLAGSDASFDAVLRRTGARRARTSEELLDIVYAAGIAPLPAGRRIGILTMSGGAGILMADAAEAQGLDVAPMPAAARKRLAARNPLCSPANPVDMTAHALNDFSLLTDSLEAIANEADYDLLAAFFTSWTASPVLGPKIRSALLDVVGSRRDRRPFALVCQGGEAVLRSFEDDGHLVFEDPARAVRALAHLAEFAEAARRRDEDDVLPEIGPEAVLPGRSLGERAAKAVLAAAGIAVIAEEHAASAEEAASAAVRLGMPVALKIDAPAIAHKSEVGGVLLGLRDAAAVRQAAEAMLRAVSLKAPDAHPDGFLVSPMAGDGVELIVGARNDPAMGPMVLVGLGGIFVEVLKDVVVEPAPVTCRQAAAMIARLNGASLLQGARGRPPLDIGAAAEAVSRLSVLAARDPTRFDSIEINPLLVRQTGAVALDALVTAGEADRPS